MIKKSQPIQFALTFFFGPLGLFYSNMAAAFALIIAAAVLVMVLSPLAGFNVWIASIIIGFGTVDEHNKKVRLKQQRLDILPSLKEGDSYS